MKDLIIGWTLGLIGCIFMASLFIGIGVLFGKTIAGIIFIGFIMFYVFRVKHKRNTNLYDDWGGDW